MKKDQVQIGGTYVAKVSGQLAPVRIDAESRFGGWDATNVSTKRKVRIKSAQRLRRAVEADGTRNEEEVEAQERPAYDPEDCATAGCNGTPAMTYLGKPLCAACWEQRCEAEDTNDVPGDACRPIKETSEQEHTMSKTKTPKKQPNTKKSKVPAKAKANGIKKAIKSSAAAAKPKRTSALDAAHAVLVKAGGAMATKEMVVAMSDQGLWSSPKGKTPHATLYAAILREINAKGKDARFRKVERGKFEAL